MAACWVREEQRLGWLKAILSLLQKKLSPLQNTVELSKMIGALDGNENIMIEANYFVLVHPAEGIGHSIG